MQKGAKGWLLVLCGGDSLRTVQGLTACRGASIRDETCPLYLAFHERMRRRLMAAVRRGQRSGRIPKSVDAETASLMLVGVGHLVTQMGFTRWPTAKVRRFQHATLRSAIGAKALAAALA